MMKLYTNEAGIELLTVHYKNAYALDKPVDDMVIPISVNIMYTHFKGLEEHKGEIYQVYEVDGYK